MYSCRAFKASSSRRRGLDPLWALTLEPKVASPGASVRINVGLSLILLSLGPRQHQQPRSHSVQVRKNHRTGRILYCTLILSCSSALVACRSALKNRHGL